MIYLAEIDYYDPAYAGVNRLFWSEDLTQDKVWRAHFGDRPAVVGNAALAPDGVSMTADKVYGTPYYGLSQIVAVDPYTDYTLSVYAKLGDGAAADPYLGLGWSDAMDGPILAWFDKDDPGFPTLTASAWTRLSVSGWTSSARYIKVTLPAAAAGKYLYLFGAQLNRTATLAAYAATAAPPVSTLRVATHDYQTHATDDPPFTLYPARLAQPGLLRREMFSGGAPGGAMSLSYGLAELINADGALDALAGCGFDGRAYRLKAGEPTAALADFTTILQGTLDQAEFIGGRLTLRLRDPLDQLRKPLAKTYRGDNAGGLGIEGGPSLKDRYKPLSYGLTQNITPVLVNEALLIYQVHDGPIQALSVQSNGVELTLGGYYATLEELYQTAPAAGTFRVYRPLGLFRVFFDQGAFTGALTAFVTPVFATYAQEEETTVGWIMDAIVNAMGLDFGYGDINALPDHKVALYLPNGETALEALERLAVGLGLWFGADALGALRVKELKAPYGTPVAKWTAAEIISLDRLTSTAPGAGVPIRQVTARYSKNWTVQTDLQTAIHPYWRDWRAQEWRQVIASNPYTEATRPLAATLELDTYMVYSNNINAFAQAWLDLLGQPRDRFRVICRVTAAQLAAVDLNSVVRVSLPRYGLDNGKLLRVLGLQTDYRTQSLELILWG